MDELYAMKVPPRHFKQAALRLNLSRHAQSEDQSTVLSEKQDVEDKQSQSHVEQTVV